MILINLRYRPPEGEEQVYANLWSMVVENPPGLILIRFAFNNPAEHREFRRFLHTLVRREELPGRDPAEDVKAEETVQPAEEEPPPEDEKPAEEQGTAEPEDRNSAASGSVLFRRTAEGWRR